MTGDLARALEAIAGELEHMVARTAFVERHDAARTATLARELRQAAGDLRPNGAHGPEGSGRASARTAALVLALRRGDPVDADDVADHLLRLDLLRVEADDHRRRQAREASDLLDTLEAALEAAVAARAVAAAQLRGIALELPIDDDTRRRVELVADQLVAGDRPDPSPTAQSEG